MLLALIGALSTVPLSILTQWSLPTFLNLSSMPVQSATIIAVLAVGLGFTRIVDTERAEFEKELNEFNLDLERELKWIDAQIWVIRRDWAYLLHGRVQSALTAALARVGDAKSVTAETIKLVHKDIERARQALFEGIGGPFDLEASLAEIAESWQGICELNLKFEPSAIKSVHEDIGLARSINEILREAISNAVRHGDAGNVVVALTQNGGVLNLKVTNDGGPVTDWSRSNLGSEMLDELTLDWSLSNQGKRVVLEARLAKATSS
jgi:signal transduction histidine kinase